MRNYVAIILLLLLSAVLSACGHDVDGAMEAYEKKILEIFEEDGISSYIDGEIVFKKNSQEKREDGKLSIELELRGAFNDDFRGLSEQKQYNIVDRMRNIDYLRKTDVSPDIVFDVVELTFKSDSDTYAVNLRFDFLNHITLNDLMFTPKPDPQPASSTNNGNSTGVFTEEELQELEDTLNEKVEIDSSIGPEDFTADGEYKPVEGMTQDEIQAELEEIIGESLGID